MFNSFNTRAIHEPNSDEYLTNTNKKLTNQTMSINLIEQFSLSELEFGNSRTEHELFVNEANKNELEFGSENLLKKRDIYVFGLLSKPSANSIFGPILCCIPS